MYTSVVHMWCGIFLPKCTQSTWIYLRKNVPCLSQVIETQTKVWDNEKCCGNTSRRSSPKLSECLYNSMKTQRTCLLFLLENTVNKTENNLISKRKFSLLEPSLHCMPTAHASSVFLLSYWYRNIFGLFCKFRF